MVFPQDFTYLKCAPQCEHFEGVEPLRGGAEWKLIRSLELMSSESIYVVLMGPLLILSRTGCYKKSKTSPSLVPGLSVLACDCSLSHIFLSCCPLSVGDIIRAILIEPASCCLDFQPQNCKLNKSLYKLYSFRYFVKAAAN